MELVLEGMFFDPYRRLEKGGQVGHHSAFTAPFRQFGEANEIEDQRGRKNGIISLPDKTEATSWRRETL